MSSIEAPAAAESSKDTSASQYAPPANQQNRYALLAGIVPENAGFDLAGFTSFAKGAVSIYKFEP